MSKNDPIGRTLMNKILISWLSALAGAAYSSTMWYTYWKYGTLYTFEYNVKTNNFDLVFVLQVE